MKAKVVKAERLLKAASARYKSALIERLQQLHDMPPHAFEAEFNKLADGVLETFPESLKASTLDSIRDQGLPPEWFETMFEDDEVKAATRVWGRILLRQAVLLAIQKSSEQVNLRPRKKERKTHAPS